LNASPAHPFGGRQSRIVAPRHCPTSSCRRNILAALRNAPEPVRLVVLEASAILEIDFTAAQVLRDLIRHCQKEHIVFAIAQLESIRAQEAVNRFGIDAQLGPDRLFHSVDEAMRVIGAAA
jgi:sulfate permease, SulP family